jgi:monoamine oxidase
MALSRRQFLMRVGQAGGYGATFTLMQTLGLLPAPDAQAADREVKAVAGHGTSVVILGGGIAGLVSAYELNKAGYKCTILEPRQRPGGRNWSVRGGTDVDFTTGFKQHCQYSEGLYLNAGPARLPSIHKTMLGYCSELGVPLEVEVNSSRSALMQAPELNGGKAVTQRRVVYDSRGYVSELLAKCIQKNELDKEISADDRDKMLTFLRSYGDLQSDYSYTGSERSGFTVFPGAGPSVPAPLPPLSMHQMLDANLWRGMLSEDVIDWQATMFEPVGGMDHIPKAFAAKLGPILKYGAQVESIQQNGSGVTIGYVDLASNQKSTIKADYCICAMPFSVLKSLQTDFAPDVKQIIDGSVYASAYKIGWQAPRFWEKDNNIYGGLSYLQNTVNIIWYPSYKMFSPEGVVIGGYAEEGGTPFGALPTVQAKLDASRAAIELLHPGRGKELKTPIYVSWGHIPHNLGSWISKLGGSSEKASYDRIIQPDRRVYFAGDHTSEIVGWQEGAALSALRCIRQIGVAVQGGNANAA